MSSPLPAASIWTVLQDKPFRGMWGASFGYFTANSMMAMAAAWMMVELQASAFVVALVQTAVFLRMFVFALPAGVVADTTDRGNLTPAVSRPSRRGGSCSPTRCRTTRRPWLSPRAPS